MVFIVIGYFQGYVVAFVDAFESHVGLGLGACGPVGGAECVFVGEVVVAVNEVDQGNVDD